MGAVIFVIFSLLTILLIVLGHNHPITKAHIDATGDVVNYDQFMRKFVYRVNVSHQRAVELLNTVNAADELSCTFDFENSIIRFSEYGSHRDYYFQILEHNGYSVLRLEQVERIGMKGTVPLKLNPFIVAKLQAEVIPYFE